jgi:hypothetical protein
MVKSMPLSRGQPVQGGNVFRIGGKGILLKGVEYKTGALAWMVRVRQAPGEGVFCSL